MRGTSGRRPWDILRTDRSRFRGAKKGEWRRRTPRRGSAAPPLPSEDVRRRPTLPHPPECSTIGAIELSFRVRNGTGRFLDAMTAVTRRDPTSPQHTPLTRHMRELFLENRTVDANTHANNTHKECCSKSSAISTSQLHTSLRFHIWPINPVIYWGPPTPQGCTDISSRSRLPA